jgi:alkanesulfonate monooxygenase SsuD/methylene tetrahydromethanopterin reductase-like flavin-dependent oxidoreductase (luciferase family)
MRLGAFIPGALTGGSAWRQPGVDTAGLSSFDAYRHVAQVLEAGKFDALFMNDGVGGQELEPDLIERNAQFQRGDPLTLLPALAVVTERIGLIATANTSYNEPFNLARRLASWTS